MSKTRKTILIAIASALKVVFLAVMTLVMGRVVLMYLGSDYNGINATSNQIISILAILEGDFSTASLTSLFEPLNKKDYKTVNGILSYSKKSFRRIAVLMLISSLALLLIYTPTVKTQLDKAALYLVFVLSIMSTIVKVGIGNKYYLLVRAEQKEYISTFIELAVMLVFRTLSILILIKTKNIILFRAAFLLETVFICVLMAVYTKKKYPFVSYDEKEVVEVRGTRDLFISKIVSAIYSSAAVMFLSSVSGTVYTSIYDVYNSIIIGVKQIIYVVINAPMNAFGKLFVEREKNEVYDIFVQYELIIIFIAFSVVSTACIVSKPFVLLYTAGVNDINYDNIVIPILLSLIALTELMHIPSGICINMTRHFSDSRKIQTITCIALLIADTLGSYFFGFYGILMGTLLVNILLAVMEISFTRYNIFQVGLKDFAKHFVSNSLVIAPAIGEYLAFNRYINSYFTFLLIGALLFFLNLLFLLLINYLFNHELVLKIYHRFLKR